MSTKPVYITRSAAFLPNAPVSNDEMERVLGQVGGRPSRARRTILRSNGIQSRHYAIDPETLKPTHNNAQLTAEAVRELGKHYDLTQVTCIASGTSIPDQIFPNHAAMVQGELKLPACEIVATSGVCVSGITALKYAYMCVASGAHEAAIATGSEAPSSVLRASHFDAEIEALVDQLETSPHIAFEKDFLRWMLSDGAGAFLLQNNPRQGANNLRVDWIEVFSYAGEMETCMYAGAVKNEDGTTTGWAQMSADERESVSVMAIKQDVKLLNENIIRYTVEKPLPGIVEKYQLRPDDIDYFVPHYSSEYFRDRLYEGMKKARFDVPQERWFTNLTRKGNTGAASMYIMLDELVSEQKLKNDQRILCWVPESGRFSGALMHLTVVK
ncbi:MAG: beta-ketoacyl-ACP synthase III [Caulobacterales bacterium]